MSAIGPFLADALVLLGVLVMTLGVLGLIRMPDVYTRLHAASKAVFLGVISLGFASFVAGDPAITWRVVLISILLLLTTPVAAHVIARAAYIAEEPMETPGAIDESGKHLDEEPAGSLVDRPEPVG